MYSILTAALTGLFLWPGGTGEVIEQKAAIDQAPEKTHIVSMTGYNAVPEQTDSTPTITASGAYTHAGVVAARSVDLAEALPFGTVIEILPKADPSHSCGIGVVEHLLGYRVIADSMHPRKRQQIDVLFDKNATVELSGKHINPARVMGVCSGVTIRVVGKVDIAQMPTTQTELARAMGDALLAVNK